MRWIFLLIFILSFSTSAQSIVDELDSGGFGGGGTTFNAAEMSTEKIEKISASGRVLILTNNSGGYGKGDFISIVLDDKLVNRSIVAKTSNGSGGIKIVKIYNPEINKLLRPGMEVKVIRGDDSYFLNRKKAAENPEEVAIIQDEEGLFDESTLLEDDLSLEENTNRKIKNDNLVSIFLSQVEGVDANRDSKRYSQVSGAWAYQLDDNIWGEASYGQTTITDFPGDQIDTTFTSLTLKVKYTVEAPFYSFIQPYAGYQIINADSPEAGTGDIDPAQAEDELALIETLKKSGPVFGVTILKRLVPGWFARIDVGSDALNFGFSLEF